MRRAATWLRSSPTRRGGPRYRGTIAIDPVELKLARRDAIPIAVNLAVAVERDRIAVTSGSVKTGATSFEFSGALDDLNAPRATFQYDATVSLLDISRNFDVEELRGGSAQIGGSGTWSSAAGLKATGNLRASGVDYKDRTITLRHGHLDGAVALGPNGIEVTGGRIGATYFSSRGQAPAEGRIAEISIRRGRAGAARRGPGPSREGVPRPCAPARLALLHRRGRHRRISAPAASWPCTVRSRCRGTGWRPARCGSKEHSGRRQALRLSANLALAPAPESAPVRGQLTASYNGETEVLDVGRSTADAALVARRVLRRVRARAARTPRDYRPERPAAAARQEREDTPRAAPGRQRHVRRDSHGQDRDAAIRRPAGREVVRDRRACGRLARRGGHGVVPRRRNCGMRPPPAGLCGRASTRRWRSTTGKRRTAASSSAMRGWRTRRCPSCWPSRALRISPPAAS